MITFLRFGHHGRLGNILYQYAFLRSASLASGQELILPDDIDNREWHSQKCLLNSFNVSYTKENYNEILKKVKFTAEEKTEHYFNFIDHYLKSIDGINYYGYFQNYLYFKKFEEQVLKELTFKEELEAKSLELLKEVKKNFKGYKIVSIQIRRGDRMNMDVHNSLNLFGPDGTLTKDCRYRKYIDSCISKISGKKVFMISTGGSRDGQDQTDVEWCRQNFKDYNYILPPTTSDIEDFALMSKCDANIIGIATSFGWWAGLLNEDRNPVFCTDLLNDFTKREAPPGFLPEKFIKVSI